MQKKNSLSSITQYFLVKRGRKDAKKGRVYLSNFNSSSLICPFFIEEISLCLNQMHLEKEEYYINREKTANLNLSEKRIEIELLIKSLQEEIKSKKLLISDLSNKKYHENNNLSTNETDDSDCFIDDKKLAHHYKLIESYAMMETEKFLDKKRIIETEQLISEVIEKIDNLEKELKLIQNKEQELEENKNLKLNTMIERCKQLYAYSTARMSAYLSGVLQILGKPDIIVKYDTLTIFRELQKELTEIESLKEGIE